LSGRKADGTVHVVGDVESTSEFMEIFQEETGEVPTEI